MVIEMGRLSGFFQTLLMILIAPVGLLIPISAGSRGILEYDLRMRGVTAAHGLTRECLSEIAAQNVKTARIVSRNTTRGLRESLLLRTESVADRIAELVGAHPIHSDEGDLVEIDRAQIATILGRHGVPIR
jgi:hypothetical protein